MVNPIKCSICQNRFGCTFCDTYLKERDSKGLHLADASELQSLKDQNEQLRALLREALPWLIDVKDSKQAFGAIISADMIRVLASRIQSVLNEEGQ